MKPKETQLGSGNTNKRELERTRIVDHNLEPGLFFFFLPDGKPRNDTIELAS